MKMLCVLLLCFLAGCAGRMTLDELENEAIVTGDWSEVEQRERLLERRNKKLGPECPDGSMASCQEIGSSVRCDCVRRETQGRTSVTL